MLRSLSAKLLHEFQNKRPAVPIVPGNKLALHGRMNGRYFYAILIDKRLRLKHDRPLPDRFVLFCLGIQNYNIHIPCAQSIQQLRFLPHGKRTVQIGVFLFHVS